VTQGAVTDKPDVHGTQSHSLTRQRQSSTNDCTYGYANEDAEGGVVLWLRYQSVTDYRQITSCGLVGGKFQNMDYVI